MTYVMRTRCVPDGMEGEWKGKGTGYHADTIQLPLRRVLGELVKKILHILAYVGFFL